MKKRPIRISKQDLDRLIGTDDPGTVEGLGYHYRCWLKRRGGEALQVGENDYADEFERVRDRAFQERDAAFMRRMIDVFKSPSKKLSGFAVAIQVLLNNEDSDPSFTQIKQITEERIGRPLDRKTWARYRSWVPLCDLRD